MHVQREGNGFDEGEHCFCPAQQKEQAVRCCTFGDVVFTGNCNVNLSWTSNSFCVLSTTREKDETNSGQKEQQHQLGGQVVQAPSSFQVLQTRYVPALPE